MQRLGSVQAEASAMRAYQLSIGLLREGASAGFVQVGTHTNSSAIS